MKIFLPAVVTLTLTLHPVAAQQQESTTPLNLAPLFQEQFVYSFNVFNGKGWSVGFVPKSEDTIYVIAGKDNALSGKKTIVYFWPITRRYMAGFKTLNEDIEGTLEIIKDGKVIKKLEKEDTVICYPEGYFGEKSILYKGEEARNWHQKYKEATDRYYEELKKYYEKRTEYRKKLQEFFEEVKKRREAGEKGPLNLEIPREPEPPKGPDFYVTEPVKYYVINLPVGRYRIRIRAKDGTIVEGSEKNLVVFTSRRKKGVGYEVIPGNRWTMEEECNDPSQIIYAEGKNVLYFRPYYQDEFNELYHNKLLDPQNEGFEENWKWVHTEPVENVYLLFYGKGGLLEKIEKKPYKVKQIPGPELGYTIVEFNEKEFPGERPTFEGYQLILSEELPKEGYRIYLREKDKNTLIAPSEREIRLVKKERINFLYYLSLFPLVIGGIVLGVRWWKIK